MLWLIIAGFAGATLLSINSETDDGSSDENYDASTGASSDGGLIKNDEGVVSGTEDNDLIDELHESSEIHAHLGNDFIEGSPDDDYILGEEGNDTIYGMSGDDWITGGEGADYIDGGAGNDTLWSGGGDTLVGGLGADAFGIMLDSVADPVNSGSFITKISGYASPDDTIILTSSQQLNLGDLHIALNAEGDQVLWVGDRVIAELSNSDRLILDEVRVDIVQP